MFYNLLAEMARHRPRITKLNIAECLEISEKTARNYLKGTSKIPWSDALKIKNTYFSELEMEYLFETDENNN